jgi:manganese transport protein
MVRERLGVRFAMVNPLTSALPALLTFAAEIGGVALVLQLVTSAQFWVPLAVPAAWLAIWRLPFQARDTVFGVLGLCLLVFAVAVVLLPTDWPRLWHELLHPSVPAGEAFPTWLFYAISLLARTSCPTR